MSSLSLETVFSCSMEIPGTMFYLKKKTMYMIRNAKKIVRNISGGDRVCIDNLLGVLVITIFVCCNSVGMYHYNSL